MIPGSNILLQAMRLIKPTTVQYFRTTGRTQNTARQWVPSFADPIALQASVQAVNRASYENLGLDFQKNYIKIFAAIDAVDIERDSSGDRFIFNGRFYQMDSQNSWFAIDGWMSCLAIDVGPATGAKF